MGRIIGYQYDDNVQDGDAWIGSEDGGGRTKQYTAEAVANYLNIQGKISIVGQMTYKYVVTPESETGSFAVFGGGTDPVAFSAVTKLTLSNQDIGGQRVVEFLNLLVGSDILITEQEAISTFGYYSIDSYAVNATDPAYYDLGVTFKSGNGSMEAEQIYEAQNFVLANDATQSPWNTVPDGISYTAADVGIGTETPSEKLEVSGNILSENILIKNTEGYKAQLNSSELSDDRGFAFPDSSGTLALTTDITSSPWDTVTGGINYANGNVGIGTTSPSNPLHIRADAPSIRIEDITSSDNHYLIGNNGELRIQSTGFITMRPGNTVSTTFSANGNVGIGTTSPSSKLHVSSVGSNSQLTLERTGTFTGKYTMHTASNNFYIGNSAASTYPLAILNTGNVGIGTTSPGVALEVQQSADNQGLKIVGFDNENNSNLHFYVDNFGNDRITSSEFLNITSGGSSSYTAAGYLRLRGVGATSQVELDGSTIKFTVTSSEKMRLTSTGLGIGTTAPLSKFQVDGQASLLGNGFYGLTYLKGTNALASYDTANKIVMSSNGSTDGLYTGGLHLTRRTLTQQGHFGSGIRGISTGTVLQDNALELYTSTNTEQNATRLKITSTGNVGIGTTSPSEKLEVAGNIVINGSSDSADGLHLKDRTFVAFSDAGSVVSRFRSSASGVFQFQDGSYNTNVVLNNNGNSYLNGGNVGIGTTAPSTSLHVKSTSAGSGYMTIENTVHYSKLDLKSTTYTGSIIMDGTGGYISGGGLILDSGTNVRTQFLQGGVNKMIINNGNVGIGTTNPSEKLDVEGNIRVGVNNGFYINNQNVGIKRVANDLVVGGFGGIRFTSSSTTVPNQAERMRITSTGNVGIGTTSPSEKLEIVGGNIKGDGIIQIESTTDNNIIGKLVVDYWSSGRPVLGSVGGSGIAIKEDLSLRFNSGLYGGTTSSNGLTIGTNRVDTPIIFKTSPVTSYVHAEHMRITGAGNVGIGTTAPSEKLEVDGQVLSDGYRLAAMQTAPAARNSTGTLGEIVIDGNHIYVCYATDSWSRVALDTSW